MKRLIDGSLVTQAWKEREINLRLVRGTGRFVISVARSEGASCRKL